MEQIRYEVIFQADEPIAHAKGTLGNHSIFMRRKYRMADGSFEDVPVITADTLRHGLFEAGQLAHMDMIGALKEPALTADAVRLLFNGGFSTPRGSGSTRFEEYRKLCDALPLVKMRGGAFNGQMEEGLVSVGDGMLVCEELMHLIGHSAFASEWLAQSGTKILSYRDHIDVEQRVRMDAMLRESSRQLLSPEDRDHADRWLAARDDAHVNDDAKARDATKSKMLPRTAEVLSPGSLVYWSVTATYYTDLDRDAMHVALATFLARARIGGKRGTGHGLLTPVAGTMTTLLGPAERGQSLDLATFRSTVGEVFRAHVKDRAEATKKVLSEVRA
jgi:hypothetical protein